MKSGCKYKPQMGIAEKLGYGFVTPEIKTNGCGRFRCHMMHDWYLINPSLLALGFKHYPTGQDGAYFKQWVNDEKLSTVSYCEGDLTIIEAPNKESYEMELFELSEWCKTI